MNEILKYQIGINRSVTPFRDHKVRGGILREENEGGDTRVMKTIPPRAGGL
jgi:hypothetical protein